MLIGRMMLFPDAWATDSDLHEAEERLAERQAAYFERLEAQCECPSHPHGADPKCPLHGDPEVIG